LSVPKWGNSHVAEGREDRDGSLLVVRLYLSSFRLGDHPDRLVELTRGQRTAAVIANACDGQAVADRSASVSLELQALGDLGFDAHEVDLRDFAGRGDALRRELAAVGVVWVRGGNVFTLRHAIWHSEADAVLRDVVSTDAIVYAGYSAGACVLAPSLVGLDRCDDPGEVFRLYGEPARFDGLGLLDRAVVPHLATPAHPESAVLEQVAIDYRRDGVAYIGLRDGQVFVVDGDLAVIL
jgi:dipeptidase E